MLKLDVSTMALSEWFTRWKVEVISENHRGSVINIAVFYVILLFYYGHSLKCSLNEPVTFDLFQYTN